MLGKPSCRIVAQRWVVAWVGLVELVAIVDSVGLLGYVVLDSLWVGRWADGSVGVFDAMVHGQHI